MLKWLRQNLICTHGFTEPIKYYRCNQADIIVGNFIVCMKCGKIISYTELLNFHIENKEYREKTIESLRLNGAKSISELDVKFKKCIDKSQIQ